MLRNLSYFNLLFAVLYFLSYLQDGSRWIIAGLLLTVVFNWMVLRNMEAGTTRWTSYQYGAGIATLAFGIFTCYTGIQLTISMISYDSYPWNTLRQVLSGFLFTLTILWQLFMSFPQNPFKKM